MTIQRPMQVDALRNKIKSRKNTDKFDKVIQTLPNSGRLIIAYSGGVDSTLLSLIAHASLGKNMLAVTARSSSNARAETDYATKLAAEIGLPHKVIDTYEIQNPNYTENGIDRCYHCKSELFVRLEELLDENDFDHIAYGLNADDMSDYRPGIKAGEDHNILAPLKEAGLTKDEIVDIARDLGLANWNKPPHPCLSTRFPFGTEITEENLNKVESAEEYLKSVGLSQFRLRAHANVARLEIPVQDWAIVLDPHRTQEISEALKPFGFDYVALDLLGFRSGSMNEAI